MTELIPSPALLSTLSGKVLLLTGGANGIGAATVRLFVSLGAKVAFCDLDSVRGEALAAELGGEKTLFVKVDVTQYSQQYAFFQRCREKFGTIDIVVANAGVTEVGDIFAPSEDLSKPPPMLVLDVNLKAALYTARLGLGFLRESGGGALVLVSSTAGFKESPGLWVYGSSKHGVYGLMRMLRPVSLSRWGIAVNTICPWMTKTALVEGIEDKWAAAGLPENESADVAKAIAITASANNGHNGHGGHAGAALPFNGKAVYVAGGRSFEIEDTIDRLEPQWLGEQNHVDLEKGQAVLGIGDKWTSKQ
ncbi:putative 15-hydroxyprostaglandin dehydrogenase [Calocera viscosa TUFC12733]|uniref:Putative 15-hydroxyprostaglandin dehydrogenase n=1 Tax=Calocera viscosa (strain TUFC12733) TaxID=1330018 RepID=A0A167ILV9_CALVF|nr:putative 15-hydroxyprostaglandin dehydrogenase [Calocera viscosa TUFC12733]